MKTGIHPEYHQSAKVICACGHTYITGATKPEIKVDVCSACHPFYTGKEKFVDTEGRVERFQRKQKVATEAKAVVKAKIEAKKQASDLSNRPNTLKDMLKEAMK